MTDEGHAPASNSGVPNGSDLEPHRRMAARTGYSSSGRGVTEPGRCGGRRRSRDILPTTDNKFLSRARLASHLAMVRRGDANCLGHHSAKLSHDEQRQRVHSLRRTDLRLHGGWRSLRRGRIGVIHHRGIWLFFFVCESHFSMELRRRAGDIFWSVLVTPVLHRRYIQCQLHH